MSLPEISRRCLSCGAAVRAGARFCPQCGKPMNDESLSSRLPARSDEGRAASNGDDASAANGAGVANESAAPAKPDAEAPREWVSPTREFSAFVNDLGFDKSQEAARAASDEKPSEARATGAGFDPAKTTPIIRPAENPAANSTARAAADAASTAASEDVSTGVVATKSRSRIVGVREDSRVERIREGARAVFEDTPEDAGLRFVVAAALLFVIFLVFLFLSTKVLR